MDHVLEIHEAHFWQLVDSLVICTMHLKVAAGANWNQVLVISVIVPPAPTPAPTPAPAPPSPPPCLFVWLVGSHL